MRYSFHGKVRASGQQVDGFVEATSSTEAIDRLADRGIIGVYSVRPEPRPVKNAIVLEGEPDPREEEERRRQLPKPPAVVPRRIATATQKPPASSTPIAPASLPMPILPAAVATAPASPATEALLLQTIEKLAMLMSRVEHALSRPMNVMYQAGPVRSTGFSPMKRAGKIPQDVQTNTLHDIFQNNLDLRKSLNTLASTVGPPPVKNATADDSATPAPIASAPRVDQPAREPVRESTKPSREAPPTGQKLAVRAQPA